MGTSQYTRPHWLCDIRAGSRLVGRNTALKLASGEGNVLVVKQLIAAGAGLDLKSGSGYEPRYRMQRLCDIRAGSRFVGRYTALMVAAGEGHVLAVEQLISAGAGLDLKSNNGYEPIYPTATAVRCPSRQPTFSAGLLRSSRPQPGGTTTS